MNKGIHPVTMPKWGMTMTEGTVANWLAKEGEPVEAGSEFLEIETTKITNVVEAQATGVLSRRLVQAGATVPVGALLGVIVESGVADAEVDAFVASYAPSETGDNADDTAAAAAQVIEAAGQRINVASTGDGEQHMLLLHGFGSDMNSWMFNLPDLAQAFRVHAIDLPAHGQSSLDIEGGAVPDLARTVLAVMDELDIARTHVVGHSLGGAIALFMAIKHPDRLQSATLICPGGLGPDINLGFIDGFITASRRKDMKTVLGQLFAHPDAVQRNMVEESLKFKRLDGVQRALQTVRNANFTDTGQAGGMRAALDSLKVPLQVIWGAEDRIIPAAHMIGLPAKIKTSLLEGAGHVPHMEQAAQVNRLIVEFAGSSGDA